MAEHEHPHHPDVDEAILQAFIALFFPRQDIHAKQIADGSQYLYYQQPVNLDLVKRHLYGEVTLGTYALTKDNHAYWVVIDANLHHWCIWSRVDAVATHGSFLKNLSPAKRHASSGKR
jgi:hypothetical protein